MKRGSSNVAFLVSLFISVVFSIYMFVFYKVRSPVSYSVYSGYSIYSVYSVYSVYSGYSVSA